MHTMDISIENLSKIEGHTNLDVKVRKGKVEEVKLEISENKRFYTRGIRGKNFKTAPQLLSRICGTCSIAHLICSIEAVEKAVGIKPSRQTMLLRKLLMYGLMIRDHALHLYLFCLPDVFDKDSILDFDEKNKEEHQLLHDCFDMKAAGNALSTIIGGRAVHAPYPAVGGFVHYPEKSEIKKVIKQLKSIRPAVLRLIKIYYDCNFEFQRKTQFVSLITNDFTFLEGKIMCSTDKTCIEESEYFHHLSQVVIPYSQASGYLIKEKEYMVGALARINLNKDSLHSKTRKDAKKFLDVFPSENMFLNNLAQAIEILHCVDHAVEILGKVKIKKEKIPTIKAKKGTGVGVIEAPRGTLYYMLDVEKDGTISNSDIVVPSQQNQINMEKDIKKLVEENLDKDKDYIQYEIEKLIRAYDPCMSCASHFLKINWK